MLSINDVRWGKYLQISVTRSAIYMDLLYTRQETALLYHFVDAVSPFLTFDPLPRYLVVKPPDSTHGEEHIGKAVASIQYTLEKISDFNDMSMPTILVMLFSEINPKDLNARSTSGDEYYGLFEKTAICFKTIYLLIPPRMVLGQAHQLDIEDLIVYDGVQLIRSYKEHQAISALKAVTYAYKSIRLKLTAMQKRTIKRNEALVAQCMQAAREEAYNDLDTCEDSCMRYANADLCIPRILETSDDVRTCIEEEHLSVSPIQRRYLYSMDPAYQYLKEVEDRERSKQSTKSVCFALHVGAETGPITSAPPETLVCQFRKRLFRGQNAEAELALHFDNLTTSPSFAQTYFNLQSICSDVQALSNTSMQADHDLDLGTKGLVQLTHTVSDILTPFVENLSQAGPFQRSFSQPLKQLKRQSTSCSLNSSHEQLSNSHVTSVAGLASAVHAFEIPFDPQSSVQNRAASVRLSSRPAQPAISGPSSSISVNPCPLPASIPRPKREHHSLLATLAIERSSTSSNRSTPLSTTYEDDSELQYAIVSAEDMNKYNATLLGLHLRVNSWEDLDICQRIELVKAIIRFLYLPDFCHVCCRDKSSFGRQISNVSPSSVDNIAMQLRQYEAPEEGSESLQNILAEYRKTLSAKGLLHDEVQPHYYQHSIGTEAIFASRTRSAVAYSLPKSSGERIKHRPPSILHSSVILSNRFSSEPVSRSMSADVKQPQFRPMTKERNRSLSTKPSQPSSCTPDPTIIKDWPTPSAKTEPPSYRDGVERKDRMIDKLGAQMSSFITYCKFSREHSRYLPAVREIVSSYMHTISTTTSFEIESTAVYCPNCSIFLGCCKRCATIFARSHQAECNNFVAFKIFSRMNDRQLEDCCRFEESQSVQKVVKIESSEANRLRKILADFDIIASRDMDTLQNYIDEKPKVMEGESNIIKEYREQQLGTLSYTDNQIHLLQQQGDLMLNKVHGIIKQKNEKYRSIKHAADLPHIPEDMTEELTKALTNNDTNALRKVLRSLLEQRRVCSDSLISDIKDINLQDKGQEHNLTTFFISLIDLLRAQYQNNLDELHVQQDHAIHDRFLAVTADLRLCSLLEVLKQDILGCTARLSQKRFNPMLTDVTVFSSGRQSKPSSISTTDASYTDMYSAMKDLAAGLLAKEKMDTRKRKPVELQRNPSYELDTIANVCTDSIESVSTYGHQNQESVTGNFEETNPIDNKSCSSFTSLLRGKADYESGDSDGKLTRMLPSPRTNTRKNTPRHLMEESQGSLLESSINKSLCEVITESLATALTIDPYRQYLIKQLPKHLHQDLIDARSYLGFRRPNSTVISFPPEVYMALEKQEGMVVILGSGTQNVISEGISSPRLIGSALSHTHTTEIESEEEVTLGYAELTYNSIYMIQPDLLLAIDELQHILDQSEFFYNDIADIIAQHSAQLRVQHKIAQLKSAIKKDLYALARASRQSRHGSEAIKITNQEVEYEYIKRYGHDMRKFVFSFSKSHSELLYVDHIEAIKAIMDSLLPLYQYTQLYLSRIQSSVQRLKKVVKDKKTLLKKTSLNLGKVSSTHRALSELTIAVEMKLRQKQLLFEKALSASPSPTRALRRPMQLRDTEMSTPRFSVQDIYSASVSSIASCATSGRSQSSTTLKNTDSSLQQHAEGSMNVIYSQGLAPKGLKGSVFTRFPTGERKVDAASNMKYYNSGLPTLVTPGILQQSTLPKESPDISHRSMSLNNSQVGHTGLLMEASKDKDTRSDGDDSHSTTVRMIARRMRRGGRKVVLVPKKSRKMHGSEECSDYEFNPDDMLGISSITVPSDKLQQEAGTVGELVDMSDCFCKSRKRRALPPLSQRPSSKERSSKELFSTNEVMELYRLEDYRSNAMSEPEVSKPKKARLKAVRNIANAGGHRLHKDRQVQQMLSSLENLWKKENIPSSQKHDLFSSSSDTELDTLTVVVNIEKELDYMQQINPPISKSYESSIAQPYAIEDFSETTMQIQRDLHVLSPDPSVDLPRKPRTNIPPRSQSPYKAYRYRQDKLSMPNMPSPVNVKTSYIADTNPYFFENVCNDTKEAENPSVLASIGSLLFSQREISRKCDSKTSPSELTSDPPLLLNPLREQLTNLVKVELPRADQMVDTSTTPCTADSKVSQQPFHGSPKRNLPPDRGVGEAEIDFKALNLSGIHKQLNPDNKKTLQPVFPAQLCTASIASSPIPEYAQDAAFQSSIQRLNNAQVHNTSQLRRLLYHQKDSREGTKYQYNESTLEKNNVLERYRQFRQMYGCNESKQHTLSMQVRSSPLTQTEHANNSPLRESLKLLEKLPRHSRILASSSHAVDERPGNVLTSSSSSESLRMATESTAESSATLIGVNLCMKEHSAVATTGVQSVVEAQHFDKGLQKIDASQRSNLQILDLSSDSSTITDTPAYQFLPDYSLLQSEDLNESDSESQSSLSVKENILHRLSSERKISPLRNVMHAPNSLSGPQSTAGVTTIGLLPPPPPRVPPPSMSSRRVHLINLPGPPAGVLSVHRSSSDPILTNETVPKHAEVPPSSAPSEILVNTDDGDRLTTEPVESLPITSSLYVANSVVPQEEIDRSDRYIESYNRLRLLGRTSLEKPDKQVEHPAPHLVLQAHTQRNLLLAEARKVEPLASITIYDIFSSIYTFDSSDIQPNSTLSQSDQIYGLAQKELEGANMMLDLFVELLNDIYMTEKPIEAFQQLIRARADLSKYKIRGMRMITRVMKIQALEVPQYSNGDFATFIRKLNLFRGNGYPFIFNNYAIMWCNFITKYVAICKHLDFLIANCLYKDINIIDTRPSEPHINFSTVYENPDLPFSIPRFNFRCLSPAERRLYLGLYSTNLLSKGSG
ncbi:Hypothetical protein DHA2_150528 [Giardia duodenalis]|uniref:Uncharacterized protein n=1 Tax=Giardia intestinalis TaxID=5741 RepID=V6T8M6_GIAIN|nr:Hypothetical protein DHA2_150528 [Giardia intestinalis]